MSDMMHYRMVQKIGNGVPTIPASENFNDGSWLETDIMEGEIYLDESTKTMYTRVGSDIVTINKIGESYYQVIDDEDNADTAPYITKTRAVEEMRISGVVSLNGEAVATVKVNGVTYVYNDLIYQGDELEFTHTTNGVTRFEILVEE